MACKHDVPDIMTVKTQQYIVRETHPHKVHQQFFNIKWSLSHVQI